MQFHKSQLLLVVPYQFPLINLHKIKSSPLFCAEARRHQEEDLSTCRVSRTHTINIKENSRANGTNLKKQELQLQTKAEMPARCDTQVRKFKSLIKHQIRNYKL